jgi:hypothetical protein
MGFENATGAHETQKMISALIFSGRYHKDGDKFLNDIIGITGD